MRDGAGQSEIYLSDERVVDESLGCCNSVLRGPYAIRTSSCSGPVTVDHTSFLDGIVVPISRVRHSKQRRIQRVHKTQRSVQLLRATSDLLRKTKSPVRKNKMQH